ncbi:MAG: SDR family oxidoreductase [Ekhidna sp.]
MRKILVTGGAGFIGSNLIASLLEHDFAVTCLDNLSTGSEENISEFENHTNFTFINGDILDFDLLLKLTREVNLVSHQAALGSVPRSINDPLLTNRVNIEGTLNVFKACVDNGVQKVVYAASSSTYGDSAELPKQEERIGKPLSPYAVTKYVNELYADVFHKVYGLNIIGLRYFNVFGPKQNPQGPYAAVIPLFIKAILEESSPIIYGDGLTSRDFTFVENAVEANIKALEAPLESYNAVYNVAYGKSTTLVELFEFIRKEANSNLEVNFGEERKGDVKHSLADISKARKFLGYDPKYSIEDGLKATFKWYKELTI